MTKERQLLKEAAELFQTLISDVRYAEKMQPEIFEYLNKINAHLSQPDAVAMTWEECLEKCCKRKMNGSIDEFLALYQDDQYAGIDLKMVLSEAAHLFMESNRVQRWIPVEERLPDVFDVLILVMQDAPGGKQYPVIKWAAYLKEENEFYTDYAQEWPTHWQPLPEVPGVYLEGNK